MDWLGFRMVDEGILMCCKCGALCLDDFEDDWGSAVTHQRYHDARDE